MSQIKRLQTIDADTLQSTAYEPVSFVIDDLLPQGLHLLAGAPKIGKSWLWLCLCAAQGKPLWTFATRPCEVLYLCLEDSFQRIQSRLFDLTEDAPPTLYCTGRDIEYQELALEFDQDAHVWKLVSSGESTEEEQDKILASLSAFLAERRKFTGTATELAEALEPYCREKMRPNVLMKYLLRRQEELSRMGIALQNRRTRDRRELALTRACDSNDGSDGKNDMEPVPDLLSQPSQLSRSHAVSSNERRANK